MSDARTKRIELMGESWYNQLSEEFEKDYMIKLGKFLARRREEVNVFPAREDMFKAFKLTPFNEVKVVILGQDPYHNGSADGLAFSMKESLEFPVLNPSINKIYDAMEDQIGFGMYLDRNPCLEYLAKQGVLLLNTILTVEKSKPKSHEGKGWEEFTIEVIKKFPSRGKVAFLLWGNDAKEYKKYINQGNYIIECEHPAASSYEKRKWRSNDCFINTNLWLENMEKEKIVW